MHFHSRCMASCRKTFSVQQNINGLYTWSMPGLSGYLVDLVPLFKFAQLNKRDKPNKLNNCPLVTADFFAILL